MVTVTARRDRPAAKVTIPIIALVTMIALIADP
jgi:hypothetical protein